MMYDELGDVRALHGVSLNGLSALASAGTARTFAPGEALMLQGGPSDTLYIILRGRVRVELSHRDLLEPIEVAELEAGEVVGEMGMLDRQPRSASVIAVEETETVELAAAQLEVVLQNHPEVTRALAGVLSRRLRDTDQMVQEQAVAHHVQRFRRN
jgi:CRP-like cAMP-binding protein